MTPVLARGFASSARSASSKSLSNMLQEQGSFDRVGKKLHKTTYQTWNKFESGSVLTPASLTCKVLTPPTRKYRKAPGVAAPPSVTRQTDPFHKLSIDPRTLTTHSDILSQYVSEMGKIKPRTVTSLTLKTQRLLGRTIRRAKMMGIIPHLSKSR